MYYHNKYLTEIELHRLCEFLEGLTVSIPYIVLIYIINYCIENRILYSSMYIENLDKKNQILQDRLKKSNIEKLEEQISSLEEQYKFLKSDYDDLIEDLNQKY